MMHFLLVLAFGEPPSMLDSFMNPCFPITNALLSSECHIFTSVLEWNVSKSVSIPRMVSGGVIPFRSSSSGKYLICCSNLDSTSPTDNNQMSPLLMFLQCRVAFSCGIPAVPGSCFSTMGSSHGSPFKMSMSSSLLCFHYKVHPSYNLPSQHLKPSP